jgi:hypothetical protein
MPRRFASLRQPTSPRVTPQQATHYFPGAAVLGPIQEAVIFLVDRAVASARGSFQALPIPNGYDPSHVVNESSLLQHRRGHRDAESPGTCTIAVWSALSEPSARLAPTIPSGPTVPISIVSPVSNFFTSETTPLVTKCTVSIALLGP